MSASDHRVCLLLGSNIEPERNLPRAIELLRQVVTVVRSSSVWQTPAVGENGPDFLNMAVLITTPFSAAELKKEVIRPLEARLGRIRSEDKYAPRPIDVDIITYDEQILDSELFRYAHRAVPVAELLPEIHSSSGDSLDKIAAEFSRTTPVQLKRDVFIEH